MNYKIKQKNQKKELKHDKGINYIMIRFLQNLTL